METNKLTIHNSMETETEKSSYNGKNDSKPATEGGDLPPGMDVWPDTWVNEHELWNIVI